MHMAESFLLVCCHWPEGIPPGPFAFPPELLRDLLSLAADQGETASVKAPLVATKHH